MESPTERPLQSRPLSQRRSKRQQRKACDLCRYRKVRCDIVDRSGGPCSVCERSEIECRSTTQWAKPNRQAPQARRGRPRQVDGHSSACTETTMLLKSTQLDDRGDDIPDCDSSKSLRRSERTPLILGVAASSPIHPSSLVNCATVQELGGERENFARSGLARFFKHGINAGAWGVFESLNSFRIAYVDGVNIGNDLDGNDNVVHYPYPPIRPKNGWKPGPDAWSGMLAHDLATEVSSFPSLEIRDALVDAYFQHVHPFHPIVSMPEFLAAYRSKDKPPPLLLFQAVLTAGAHACSHPLVASSRHAVKRTLFRRASMLFHMRHETDRAYLMQAAILFTRHMGDGDTVTGGPWYWSGIAVRIGCGLGMHRYSSTLPPLEASQYRRCWWSAFVCEVFSSIETGRPCAVRAEDIDQLPLSVEDMTDTASASDPGLYPNFIIRMVDLAHIGLDILALNEPVQRRTVDVHGINARLCQWALESGTFSSSIEEGSWDYQLQMHYNLMLLHLHRNFSTELNSQDVCSVAAKTITRSLEKLADLDCLCQCHFTAVSAVTAAGIQLANEIRLAVTVGSFLVAINGLENLNRLLRSTNLLAGYWPNAEAVHSMFKEIYHEYKSYVTQGLQGEPVMVSENQPDWYRLLAEAQPVMSNFVPPDWMSIVNESYPI
ncbi:acetamidase regulatory protein, putative [Talaromyces stipitatus ATCC 10500]|uniref:Acetamidase regulatory protein, putative n=1 Tax=Talaromyces stipitatus (strain ATCC 10500 / CBS 375.48 / QM 6759 / NRRL 1006) TaxID=441959 RepID=B8MFJ8_TALSN|nr:acetamidase regulatory protein, putative [Talaromyces stipitatus ATCC 10500]EED16988.1 acetamidase regulatory protein, putative [Talaromyces stipitatus ATCC 10500]